MPRPTESLIDRITHRRALKLWRRAAGCAAATDLDHLKAMRGQARALRRELDQVLHVADGRLALPLVGTNAMRRPIGADWLWRPSPWRGAIEPQGIAGAASRSTFSAEVTLFHDCPLREATLRQVRNSGAGDLAPFGLVLDLLGFEGSFLSLALDLPQEAVTGLKRRHILRVDAEITCERPCQIFARLNVKNGPNTEQFTEPLAGDAAALSAEFDLGFSKVDETRLERIWLDLSFETPAMNRIALRDLTMCRRPRAEI